MLSVCGVEEQGGRGLTRWCKVIILEREKQTLLYFQFLLWALSLLAFFSVLLSFNWNLPVSWGHNFSYSPMKTRLLFPFHSASLRTRMGTDVLLVPHCHFEIFYVLFTCKIYNFCILKSVSKFSIASFIHFFATSILLFYLLQWGFQSCIFVFSSVGIISYVIYIYFYLMLLLFSNPVALSSQPGQSLLFSASASERQSLLDPH